MLDIILLTNDIPISIKYVHNKPRARYTASYLFIAFAVVVSSMVSIHSVH